MAMTPSTAVATTTKTTTATTTTTTGDDSTAFKYPNESSAPSPSAPSSHVDSFQMKMDKTGDDTIISSTDTTNTTATSTLQQKTLALQFQTTTAATATTTAGRNIDDQIAHAVQELWLTSPGMGIQELFLKVNERIGGVAGEYPPTALKRRIRAVKQGLPYRYQQHDNDNKHNSNNDNDNKKSKELDAFVQSRLEDRQSLRTQKRYKDADRIAAGLQAMGIVVDDTTKTWHIQAGGVAVSTTTLSNDQQPSSSPNTTTTDTTANTNTDKNICHICGQSFASRNLIFRHLRDPASSAGSCGTSIFASNQTVPVPPSVVKKEEQQQVQQARKHKNRQQTKQSRKSGNTQVHDPKDSSLWVGDLPLCWTRHGNNYQRLRLLLRAYLPRSVPPPWIKMVKRKAYKSASASGGSGGASANANANANATATAQHDDDDDDADDSNNDDDDDNDNDDNNNNSNATASTPTYLGYAIIVFRDAQEAALVHQALEGQEISANYAVDDLKKKKKEDPANATAIATAEPSSWADSTPNFLLKVRPVEHEATAKNKTSKQEQPPSSTATTTTASSPKAAATVGQDPPLIDQLRPLSTEELRARTTKRLWMAKNHENNENNANAIEAPPPGELRNDLSSFENGSSSLPSLFSVLAVASSEDQQHEFALEQAVQAYQQQRPTTDNDSENGSSLPRPVRYYKGRLVPLPLITALLDILKTLRWAVPNHRHGLTSERYLVLMTKVKRDLHYNDLREACRALMDWADPHYFYSGIAVTKNFCGSPHIDGCDQTYQYAVSLGDFDYTRGGQLCVEGCEDENLLLSAAGTSTSTTDFVNVVETRNRIARVDGRHVHWVRTFGQGQEEEQQQGGGRGDRYSLIFYDTSDRHVTPVISSGVDLEYLQTHRGDEEITLD
jgi:hypothetical protein